MATHSLAQPVPPAETSPPRTLNNISAEQHALADNNLAKAQAILQVLSNAGPHLEKVHRDNAIWAADDLIAEARQIYGEV